MIILFKSCDCFVCFSSFVKTVKVMVSIKLAYGSGTALASLSRKVML